MEYLPFSLNPSEPGITFHSQEVFPVMQSTYFYSSFHHIILTCTPAFKMFSAEIILSSGIHFTGTDDIEVNRKGFGILRD